MVSLIPPVNDTCHVNDHGCAAAMPHVRTVYLFVQNILTQPSQGWQYFLNISQRDYIPGTYHSLYPASACHINTHQILQSREATHWQLLLLPKFLIQVNSA